MRKNELERVARVIVALEKGVIRNIGSVMMDANHNIIKEVFPSDMFKIRQDLSTFKIYIERKDAGGTPTWGII